MQKKESKKCGSDCLNVQNLRISFFTRKQAVKVVDDISFSVRMGEVLGIVGESGCGKTITALSIMGLVPYPGRIEGGEIWFKGTNLVTLSQKEIQQIRGRRISIVLQDPFLAMNPLFTVGNQLLEVVPEGVSRKTRQKSVVDILGKVRIAQPHRVYEAYPHELSGGMNQRCVIGMGLLPSPEMLIADEPTTSLDVTTQAQVLKLLSELQQETGMAMILITHDLAVVASICTNVIVMYCGKIVEKSSVRDLFNQPRHPYTRGLLASIPKMEGTKQPLVTIPGQPGVYWDSLKGCPFADRCQESMPICKEDHPPDFEVSKDHHVSCWRVHEH